MTLTDEQIRSFLARLGDAAPPAPDFDQLVESTGPGQSASLRCMPRAVALTAAFALVAVGVIGVALAGRDTESASDSDLPDLPADPAGPLFVLPTDLDTYEVSAGQLSVPNPAESGREAGYQWAVIGRPADGGFDDPVGVMVLGPDARVDELLALGEWEEVGTSNGRAHVLRSGPGDVDMAVQQRESDWLRLTAPGTNDVDLADILDEIEVAASGTISIMSGTHTVLGQGTETVNTVSGIGFTAVGRGRSFWIETAAMSSPLAAFGPVGSRVEPIAIGTSMGWLISQRTTSGFTPYALVWSATPRRIIAVGTNADRPVDRSELVQLAEHMRIVDESTWRAALPDATGDLGTNS